MATSSATDTAVEAVVDAAEFVSDEAAQLADAARDVSRAFVRGIATGGVFGIGIGFFIGWRVLDKKIQQKYQEIADGEIDEMRRHYYSERPVTPTEAAKPALKEVVHELGYASKAVPTEAPPVVEVEPPAATVNVFDHGEWDYAEEVKARRADIPYVIHEDEFRQGVFGADSEDEEHEQSSLTYFAGDDVLSDERDTQITEVDKTVGLENLEKFGHGSTDPSVVFVRNERLKMDYEITRSDGKFATEVHGFQEDELQHSDGRRHRPNRQFDDGSG